MDGFHSFERDKHTTMLSQVSLFIDMFRLLLIDF